MWLCEDGGLISQLMSGGPEGELPGSPDGSGEGVPNISWVFLSVGLSTESGQEEGVHTDLMEHWATADEGEVTKVLGWVNQGDLKESFWKGKQVH